MSVLVETVASVLSLSVCTCVVHKRCHQHVVTKCPGMKDDKTDEVMGINLSNTLVKVRGNPGQ